MSPVIIRRLEDRKGGFEDRIRVDVISWTLDVLDEYPLDPNSTVAYHITNKLLQNNQAVTLNPASIITQMIFQILEETKYLGPLQRSEGSSCTTWPE